MDWMNEGMSRYQCMNGLLTGSGVFHLFLSFLVQLPTYFMAVCALAEGKHCFAFW